MRSDIYMESSVALPKLPRSHHDSLHITHFFPPVHHLLKPRHTPKWATASTSTGIQMDDDLTASHWDDVILPLTKFGSSSALPAELTTLFGGLNILDPVPNNQSDKSSQLGNDDNDEDDNDDDDDHDDNKTNDENTHNELASVDSPFGGSSAFYSGPRNQAEADQLEELRKEERQEKTSNLLSNLTQGSESPPHEPKGVSPRITASDSLFDILDGPLKLSDSHKKDGTSDASPTKRPPLNLKSSQFKVHRGRRYPSLTVVNQLQRQTEKNAQAPVDNPLGPLGDPVGSNDNNETDTPVNKADQLVQESNAPLYNIEKSSDKESSHQGLRPQHKSQSDDGPSKTPPEEHSEEDNTNNALEISVGDPIKIGDITTAHIVYTIKTKNLNPKSSHFPHDISTISVSRRYRDFRWIYHQLQSNHPGRIIPPPPSKQTYIGRFNENFIENRRFSLEKMLNKIGKIADFANDADYVMFLTSQDFANELKERERISGSGASATTNDALDNESTDALSGSSGAPLVSGTSAGGFMSSLFSMPTKLPEPDEYFSKKKLYIEDLEHNLRTFYKSLELIAGQRLEIVGVIDEMANTINELADLEILKTTSELLEAFADVQRSIRENLDRVNIQDNLTLGFTIEEYLRIIGSVKFIFDTRTKVFQQYHSFKQEYLKKEEALEKLTHKYKSSVEKINMLKFEVDKLRQKTEYYENSFNNISATIKREVDTFEIEKIKDFRNSVEIFIESSIESQKEAIELWETFYERHGLSQV